MKLFAIALVLALGQLLFSVSGYSAVTTSGGSLTVSNAQTPQDGMTYASPNWPSSLQVSANFGNSSSGVLNAQVDLVLGCSDASNGGGGFVGVNGGNVAIQAQSYVSINENLPLSWAINDSPLVCSTTIVCTARVCLNDLANSTDQACVSSSVTLTRPAFPKGSVCYVNPKRKN